ncbi:Copper transport protein ATX1 [Spatholobus suberectus]|nr:Copper transport protein ATX1 [Spatholobus suberectus]
MYRWIPFTGSPSIIHFLKTKTYLFVSLILQIHVSMARESQAPRVTQIQVRVDCNGCVQKIKKALNGIHGIHDLRVDIHRQKLTIIGWADPEQVVKAIKKTKKNATICSSIELTSPSKPTEPEPKKCTSP